MNPLDKLTTYFENFPGIGGRQARRFAFHLLMLPKADLQELSQLIAGIQDNVIGCTSCRRFFSQSGTETVCNICADPNRDISKLMVVERDSDINAIERSGTYQGLYFVLGGTIPLLESKEKKTLRGNGLKKIVHERKDKGLTEIILAFSVNPDGENTARYVESLLKEELEDTLISFSHLGRGLSTGSELEYADPETIKNALANRQ